MDHHRHRTGTGPVPVTGTGTGGWSVVVLYRSPHPRACNWQRQMQRAVLRGLGLVVGLVVRWGL